MTMQYDVKSVKRQSSGQILVGRYRVKQLNVIGNGTAGYMDVFDTTTAPTSVTYSQTGTTITVTHNTHGYSAGQQIGLAFLPATGVAAVSGNYTIVTVATNTYTVTAINSESIAGGTGAFEAPRYVYGLNTSSGVQPFQVLVPGEGFLVENGAYINSSNISSVTVTYG